MTDWLEILNYGFMVRAIIMGLLVAISAALVGTSLVLRKNSMIGDGLSHVAFGAFAIATVLQVAPLEFALPIVVATSMLILRMGQKKRIQNDATIAILSASALALGTFVISITKGVNTDISNYLFGSILAISGKDLIVGGLLLAMVVVLYGLSYHRIFALTFDETFARSTGVKVQIYDVIFAVICSIIIVLGMRLLGALLISSLIVFPTVTAMQICKNYNKVVLFAVVLAILNFTIGIYLSFYLKTPTGASIVLVSLVTLVILSLVGHRK